MKDLDYDILISGAGVAGLIAAVAFGDAGFTVLCVDPNEPVTDRNAKGADLRTTAYLQPSQEFLASIGVWPLVDDIAMPLETMRIVDISTETERTHDFNSSEISEKPFGYNVGNWAMRAALLKRLKTLPKVKLVTGVSTTSLVTRTSGAFVKLSDGKTVRTNLVIGADGRNSPVRKLLGIDVTRTDFEQSALTFAVTHAIPHQNVSSEIHQSGGPFTLVPLPDLDGTPCSAVVWMERKNTAQELSNLDVPSFENAATKRSGNILGELSLVGRRTSWPIISQMANSLTGERTALIAEAAHVVPPIGAQGLNMSVADIQCLRDLVVKNPSDIGQNGLLAQYERKRLKEIKTRVMGVNLLNRFSMQDLPMLQTARSAGLSLFHNVTPVRRMLMRLGLRSSQNT